MSEEIRAAKERLRREMRRKRKTLTADYMARAGESIQAQILALLKKLNRETGMSMLLISHNLNVMRKLCSFVAVMNRGLLVETGKTEDVYSNPQDPYTRQLIDAIPTREGRGKWQKN